MKKKIALVQCGTFQTFKKFYHLQNLIHFIRNHTLLVIIVFELVELIQYTINLALSAHLMALPNLRKQFKSDFKQLNRK